jgi:hypothetical protein
LSLFRSLARPKIAAAAPPANAQAAAVVPDLVAERNTGTCAWNIESLHSARGRKYFGCFSVGNVTVSIAGMLSRSLLPGGAKRASAHTAPGDWTGVWSPARHLRKRKSPASAAARPYSAVALSLVSPDTMSLALHLLLLMLLMLLEGWCRPRTGPIHTSERYVHAPYTPRKGLYMLCTGPVGSTGKSAILDFGSFAGCDAEAFVRCGHRGCGIR